jgi:hypothetical protein
MEKKCNKCNVVKDVSQFGKRKVSKDGLRNECKLCLLEYQRAYYKVNEYKLSKKNKEYRESKLTTKQIANRLNVAEKLKLIKEGNKRCTKCLIIKNTLEFHKSPSNKDGLTSHCMVCRNEKSKKYEKANREKINLVKKKYREDNKDRISEYRIKYKEDNRDKIKEATKKYSEVNRDKIKEYRKANKEHIAKKNKEYRLDNKENLKNYNLEYVKSRTKTDSLFKLKLRIRGTVTRYLKDGKSKTTREIIGIGFKEFQDYLEVEYTDGMHLDHIIPLSWANNDEEVYILNHYSNFQIITAEENLAKKDTYCKSENLKKVLDNHNNITKLNKIIERNSDKIK